MDTPASHRQTWLIASIVIICIAVGYALAQGITNDALSKAPLQCPATCTGDNCPMHQTSSAQ